jgi:hypothetical protein
LVCLSLLFFFALFGFTLLFVTLILVHFVLFSFFFLWVVFVFLEHLLIRVDLFTTCNQEQVPVKGIGASLSFSLVVFFKAPGTGG